MKRRPASIRPRGLLLASACLLLLVTPEQQAWAQEWPTADSPNPLANTTRKLDEYGKIGHCDETARLDNFAIELQNEPTSKGYLLVYVGKHDLPSWTDGILQRAAYYLVNSRGLETGRIKVVNGGYREERTTELWVVPENEPAPQPSNTIEFKLDRSKAYQWDEDSFNVEFNPDDSEGAEAEAEGEAVADEAAAETSSEETEAATAGDQAPEAESAEEAEWKKEAAKYEIAVVARGVIENEPEEGDSGAKQAEADDGSAEKAAEGEEAGAEPEGPPTVGEIKISLWWNVEALKEELKTARDARLCLIFYWGIKNATQERVKEMVEQALVKTEEQLGVKRERIIVIDGGRSPDPGVELWVVPPGAEPPKPTPGQTRKFGFYTMSGED